MANMKQIREAIIKNRGGWNNAPDDQIRTVWDSLSTDIQKEYLESIKPKGRSNANAERSKIDV